ncbi:MAG: carbohydrate kinase family protein [Nanoarchaeota archaeon]
MLDVLTIGSATVDHFLTISQSFSSLKPGDKILVTHSETHSGGGATNAAAALAKLGLKVKMLAKLGDDHDAKFILQELKQYGVENICRRKSRHHTDTATLISSTKDKNRIIFVFKEASRDLALTDVKAMAFKATFNAKWIYLGSLMGKSFQVAKKIAQQAKKKSRSILFNPSQYLAQKGKQYLKPILENTVILVLNKEEAQAVLGTQATDLKFLLRELQKTGPGMVIITDGRKRLYALRDKTLYSLLPPHVKIVDTAGAGDAFTAGFLGGMIKQYAFEDALRLGQANASSVIQHHGCKQGLLTEREAGSIMKKWGIKVKKSLVQRPEL